MQGSKAELQALLMQDGLFSGKAKVGFQLAPKDVTFKEKSWIESVVDNARARRAACARRLRPRMRPRLRLHVPSMPVAPEPAVCARCACARCPALRRWWPGGLRPHPGRLPA